MLWRWCFAAFRWPRNRRETFENLQEIIDLCPSTSQMCQAAKIVSEIAYFNTFSFLRVEKKTFLLQAILIRTKRGRHCIVSEMFLSVWVLDGCCSFRSTSMPLSYTMPHLRTKTQPLAKSWIQVVSSQTSRAPKENYILKCGEPPSTLPLPQHKNSSGKRQASTQTQHKVSFSFSICQPRRYVIEKGCSDNPKVCIGNSRPNQSFSWVPGTHRRTRGNPCLTIDQARQRHMNTNFLVPLRLGQPPVSPWDKLGCTPRGSCNNTLLRRVLRRFSNSKCFLEGACKGFQ